MKKHILLVSALCFPLSILGMEQEDQTIEWNNCILPHKQLSYADKLPSAFIQSLVLKQLEKDKAILLETPKNFTFSCGSKFTPHLSFTADNLGFSYLNHETLSATGNITLEESTITTSTTIGGNAIITKSACGALTIGGSFASLKKCRVSGVVFNERAGCQCLELCKTTIEGDIIFTGKNGFIIMDQNSQITGQIRGGIVIQEK
jgi:hypothetical protein